MSDLHCILKVCPTLGGCKGNDRCGAAYVLAQAQRPQGYEVIRHNNPLLNAMIKAGMVRAPLRKTGNLLIVAKDLVHD